ncbi:MAG: alpha/beta hydrolase [Candidatus Hydrogenedentota bacterium]
MRRIIAGLFMLFTVVFSAQSAQDLFAEAPPAPKGYATYEEARAAMRSGEVERVEPPSEISNAVTFHDDVVFASHDGVTLSLDIFVPKNIENPRPLLLFIHGGGWSKGKKEDYLFYNIEFAKLGYVTASTQYRLTPDHVFPANVRDVKCAITFLRDHASEYQIDPAKVVTIGGSAGGHLSLMAGYVQNPALDCPDNHGATDTSVQAVVNLYGVVDCTTPVAIAAHQVQDYIGKPYDEAKEAYEDASPIHHLDANDPPTLTFHGTSDELVPVSQADTLHAKLDELGIANYYDRIEGWPHSMDVAKPINDRCRYIIQRFLEKHVPIEK